MGRSCVVTTTMFKVKRKAPNKPCLGWGPIAVRKETTEATSPRLLSYRACMAGHMAGSSGSLMDIQKKFRETAHACSASAGRGVVMM